LIKHSHQVLAQFSRLVAGMDTVEGRHTPDQLFEFYKPNTGPVDVPTGKGISYNYPEIPLPQKHPFKKQKSNKDKLKGFVHEEHPQSHFAQHLQNLVEQTHLTQHENCLFDTLWV